MSMESAIKGKQELENSMKLVILTDLDATLLDHNTYSFEPALEALSKVKARDIPIIPVTSKTWHEVVAFQSDIEIYNKYPAIVENGSATYIPEEFINNPQMILGGKLRISKKENFWIIEYAKSIYEARHALKSMSESLGISKNIRSFGEMSVEDFSQETGLSIERSRMALEREYQEGFSVKNLNLSSVEKKLLEDKMSKSLELLGFNLTSGGRYYQVTGDSDKGIATTDLIKILRAKYGRIYSIGLGDAKGDLPLIESCDEGYILNRKEEDFNISKNKNQIILIEEAGPSSWNKVVNNVLARFQS